MILNYLKKNFFQKTKNFNDFKLFKKKFFSKNEIFLMILNYLKKNFFLKKTSIFL